MLCFETIWAQQGVFLGAMASSRMSWNALTLMPALPPRLHVGSGSVPLLWPQSQPLALSLGLMLGNVVQAGATCYSPLCQCFRGRKLHVMMPLLKMGKVKWESRMFWVERSAIADWIAKNRLPWQPFTTFVVRFGASTKQPKTAFFGEYRTWLNMVVQKGALQVVVATAALVPPAAMVAVLKQNRHPPTLAVILETSMSTRGTFKAGPVNVCHLTLMSLLIHSFNVGSHPGIQVCREAFCKLLGIGSWRLVRTRRAFQGEDLRKYGILSLKYTTLWETQCALWKLFEVTLKFLGNVVSRTNHAAASVLSFLEKMYWSLGETLPHEPLVHVLWNPPFMYFASFPPIIIKSHSKVENSWSWKAIGNWTRKGTTSSIAARLCVGKWLVEISVEPGTWSAHPPVPSSWHLFWFVPPLCQLSICKEPESVFSINILPGVGIKWMEKGPQVPACQSAHRLHHMPEVEGQGEACQRCVRACPRSWQIDETFDWTIHGQINLLVLQDKGKTRYGHLNCHYWFYGSCEICGAAVFGQSYTKRCSKSESAILRSNSKHHTREDDLRSDCWRRRGYRIFMGFRGTEPFTGFRLLPSTKKRMVLAYSSQNFCGQHSEGH